MIPAGEPTVTAVWSFPALAQVGPPFSAPYGFCQGPRFFHRFGDPRSRRWSACGGPPTATGRFRASRVASESVARPRRRPTARRDRGARRRRRLSSPSSARCAATQDAPRRRRARRARRRPGPPAATNVSGSWSRRRRQEPARAARQCIPWCAARGRERAASRPGPSRRVPRPPSSSNARRSSHTSAPSRAAVLVERQPRGRHAAERRADRPGPDQNGCGSSASGCGSARRPGPSSATPMPTRITSAPTTRPRRGARRR